MMIAPSLFAARPAHLQQSVAEVESFGAKYLHIDVMDGHFVPNLSFGPNIVAGLRGASKMIFDVHLMIERPEHFTEAFLEAGADSITVHFEAVNGRTIANISQVCAEHSTGFGIALCPQTSISQIERYLPMLDILLIMSINPGFGGQAFQPEAAERIREAFEMRDRLESRCKIGVDGGINPHTAALCRQAGADILVAGTSIFGSPDKKSAMQALLA